MTDISETIPPSTRERNRNGYEPMASLAKQLGTLFAIVFPLTGVLLAIIFCWEWGFSWGDLGLMLGMYLATSVGITVGFHRLFTHRSFETNIFVKAILAMLGSMALQGSLIKWVAMHRKHHQHSDTPEDVHSPHFGGKGILGFIKGFYHAHIGWAFREDPENLPKYVPDLRKSATLRVISATFPVWAFVGLLIPAALGGLISGTWTGMLSGLIWGGLVRLFLVHHVTWSVNSACHLWGRRPFASNDESRNNFIFGILAMGEGWHNAHHAFPTSARHGLRWWEIDASYYMIKVMSWMGLAWNLTVPSKQALKKARATA